MKDVTYGQFVCTVQPEKAEPNRMHFTVGGDRINYPDKVANPTAEILVAKMLFNSVISTKGARFMTMDTSNFYLMTPLHHPKFIHVKLSDIPDEVIEEYTLREKATKNGSVYIKAKRGLYSLPQSHQSQARTVQPTAIRIIGKQTPQKMIEQTLLPTKQIGTRSLKTRHTANTIHISC
jgi:hypothetical protein